MHIEPGFIAQTKIMFANLMAGGVLLNYARELVRRPADLIRTTLAALFFSIFMQSFSVSVGPSELHFVGAMVMYLSLGFIPTLFGFAAGLLLQGILFDPQDLMHLTINSLSLIVPLIAVHMLHGRKLRNEGLALSWKTILKLDAMYYSGLIAMVGFWLSIAEVATPFAAWLSFASSYLIIVLIEPLLTYSVIHLLKNHQNKAIVDTCFDIKSLNVVK